MQERVLHLYRHSARCHPVLRHRTFHGYIADGVRLGLQRDGSQVFLFGALPDGLVADVGDAGEHILPVDGDDEESALVRNAAIEQGGVHRIEHSDVGQSQRLVVFVGDDAREVTIAFLHTFHIDLTFCPMDSHSDGIEPNHLTNSLRHRLFLDAGRDTKVLQIIIEEIDRIARLRVIQLTQCLVKRHIIEFARDTLSLTRENSYETGHNEKQSSHSLFHD